MSQLSICLLGSFDVRLAGQPVTDFSSNKTRALLTYLAVETEHSHQRARLADLFWPDWPEKTARTYLRQSLANLRHILPDSPTSPPYFLPDRQSVRFNPACDHRLDVVDLSQALSRAAIHPLQTADAGWLTDLERTADAYRGDFLEGFFLDGCPGFEEWQLLIREHCHRNAVDAFGILSSWYELAGEFTQALVYVRRQSALEPLSEEVHRRCIRLLLRTGQRHIALETHAFFVRRLGQQLGVKPARETEALAAQIRDGALAADAFLSSPPLELTGGQPQFPLPYAPTPLIGRQPDVTTLVSLLRQFTVHLVTLTGPAGVGKSRLALEVANSLHLDFPDGIAFVPMDSMEGTAELADGLCRGLGLPSCGEGIAEERVRDYMQGRRMLVLLDSFEQAMDARRLLGELLSGCPGLHLLVTSREVLHLQAEHVYPVSPLVAPEIQDAASPEKLAQSPAVALFVERAQAARPDFVLNRHNAQAVAEICIHLDGLPLAIELAAARCALLPTRTLLERLDNRFQLLRGGAQDAPDRHQTLYSAITWSYDLLPPKEQALFRRMAFFADGCTLEEVGAVCTPNDELGLDPLEGVASLLDKSLIHRRLEADPSDTREPRFGMLESIRAFGMEKLCGADECALLRCRQTRYEESVGMGVVD